MNVWQTSHWLKLYLINDVSLRVCMLLLFDDDGRETLTDLVVDNDPVDGGVFLIIALKVSVATAVRASVDAVVESRAFEFTSDAKAEKTFSSNSSTRKQKQLAFLHSETMRATSSSETNCAFLHRKRKCINTRLI